MLISWNTTKACNLKCRHCYRDAGKKEGDELSLEEAKSLLEEIELAGFKIVVLSGGEPLLREDIFEIISYGKKLGLRIVLGTNGTLITREVAKKLKEAGLARVGVSLDSRNPAVHDAFRGVEGSFRKVLEGIDALGEVGLEFQVHTTVAKYNYKEIESLIDFVINLGAKAYHVFFLVPAGRGREVTQNIISPEEYYALISKILDRQKDLDLELKPVCAPQFIPIALRKGLNLRFKRGCLAALSYCCILPNGDVHPCPYLPLKLGNVRETSFSTIWRESPILNELRTLNYKGKCGVCNFKELCGGCRARAYFHFDEYMHQHYYCSLNYGQD
jgi:putative heme d1 biosynthesis radical SAM protein NirJ2